MLQRSLTCDASKHFVVIHLWMYRRSGIAQPPTITWSRCKHLGAPACAGESAPQRVVSAWVMAFWQQTSSCPQNNPRMHRCEPSQSLFSDALLVTARVLCRAMRPGAVVKPNATWMRAMAALALEPDLSPMDGSAAQLARASVRKDGPLDAALIVALQKLAAAGVTFATVKLSDAV